MPRCEPKTPVLGCPLVALLPQHTHVLSCSFIVRITELFLGGFEFGASNVKPFLHSNAVPMIEMVPALSLVEAGVEVSRHDGSGHVGQPAFVERG